MTLPTLSSSSRVPIFTQQRRRHFCNYSFEHFCGNQMTKDKAK